LNPESTPNRFELGRPSISISPPISKTEADEEDKEEAPPLEAWLECPTD
jgi:hypothetical protein